MFPGKLVPDWVIIESLALPWADESMPFIGDSGHQRLFNGQF